MFALPGGTGNGFGEGRDWLQGFRRFFDALFSTARAGEFEVLSARGCVALLLTRSHAMFVLLGGVGSGFGEGRAWLQGFGRLFEALFSAAGAGELIVLSARGCVALLLTRSHARFCREGWVAVSVRRRLDREVLDASSKLCSRPLARTSLLFWVLAGRDG
jgi:hypothetical protein